METNGCGFCIAQFDNIGGGQPESPAPIACGLALKSQAMLREAIIGQVERPLMFSRISWAILVVAVIATFGPQPPVHAVDSPSDKGVVFVVGGVGGWDILGPASALSVHQTSNCERHARRVGTMCRPLPALIRCGLSRAAATRKDRFHAV